MNIYQDEVDQTLQDLYKKREKLNEIYWDLCEQENPDLIQLDQIAKQLDDCCEFIHICENL